MTRLTTTNREGASAPSYLPPDLLRRVGEALYGAQWITPMWKALGHSSDRAVRRWNSRQYPIPGRVAGELLDLVQREGRRRVTEIAALERALKAMAK